MLYKHFKWVFPAVLVLAACSLAGAVLRPCPQRNMAQPTAVSVGQYEAAVYDPNAPDPDGGVPTAAPAAALSD